MGFQSFNRRRSNNRTFRVLFLLLSLNCVSGDNNSTTLIGHGDNSPPPHEFSYRARISFRPSIVIIVAALTTLFSITFLFLLYVKHCRNVGNHPSDRVFSYSNSVYERKSGIDRTVVESLPVFRFGSLTGQKEGLECAVCLNVFEVNEVLRLLPKCKHAFHVECVDTWLDAHSTCPLCRYRVDPEDLLLIIDSIYNKPDEICDEEQESQPRRVPGRHSFAGVRDRDRERGVLFSFRKSLDGFRWKRKSGNEGPGERYLRKDGSLMTKSGEESGGERERIEHRINVVGPLQRWSDSSLLLCVRSEMLMASPSMTRNKGGGDVAGRCLSDITKIGRLSASEARRVEALARWLGWAPHRSSGGESLP